MKRARYFNYIDEKLATLSTRISTRGKLNLMDLHVHSETFFADLLNHIFGWNLVNLNTYQPNVEAIDLIDHGNKMLAQVSATCTKQKIVDSLEKCGQTYCGYSFKFVSIAKEASAFKKEAYQNMSSVIFIPETDVIDNATLLRIVQNMKVSKQEQIYDFIKEELGSETELIKVNTNLAKIIKILSDRDLNEPIEPPELRLFKIEKKIDFNELSTVRKTINDYKLYYNKVSEVYSTFDKEGCNKSLSVLQVIRRQYIKRQNTQMPPSDIFYSIIDDVRDIVTESKNYVEIPFEELDLCVSILVVDAFIKCKIFENPEGCNLAITR